MKKHLYLFTFILFIILGFLPYILSNPLTKSLIETKLEKKFGSKVSIQRVNFSWQGPQKLTLVTAQKNELSAVAQEVILNIPFWQVQNFESHISINNIEISINTNPSLKIENGFVLIENQNIQAEAKTSSSGFLNIQGTFKNADTFQIQLNIQNFPSQLLDLAFPKISFKQVLGNTFSSKGNIEKNVNNWKINTQISSQLIVTDVDLEVKNNKIVLLKPFFLKTICQDFCEKHLLALTAQDLIKNITFLDPITIEIQDHGFIADLNIKNLSKTQIFEAEVNLGKVEITLAQKLAPLLQIFQKAKIGQDLSLWFTPAIFSLNDAILDLKRIDILINNSFPIFSWGQVNLIDHSLNITLAIPGPTISKIYGVKSIPSKYNLLVKVSGTLENPIFDINAALAKLAIITGLKQGLNQVPGIGGKILNNALDIFNEKIENVPPPTSPTPW